MAPKIETTNVCLMQYKMVSVQSITKLCNQKGHVFLCIVKAANNASEKGKMRERMKEINCNGELL